MSYELSLGASGALGLLVRAWCSLVDWVASGFYVHPKFAASIRGPSRPDTHPVSPVGPLAGVQTSLGWVASLIHCA